MVQKLNLVFFILVISISLSPFVSDARANSGANVSELETLGYPDLTLNRPAAVKEQEIDSHASITTGMFGGDSLDLSVFDNFGENILHSFMGRNFYYRAAAVAVTPMIVISDLDYQVQHFFNQNPAYGRVADVVPYSGMLLQFIAGGSILTYGEIKDNEEVLGAFFCGHAGEHHRVDGQPRT